MGTILKFLNFEQNEVICTQGENVDFFAFVAYGRLKIGNKKKESIDPKATLENPKDSSPQANASTVTHYIGLGEMIGHQNLAEQDGSMGQKKWLCDIVGDQKGILAVLPFGEFRHEIKHYPTTCCKLVEMAA